MATLCGVFFLGVAAQAVLEADPFGDKGVIFKTWIISDLLNNPQSLAGVNMDSSVPGNMNSKAGAVSIGQVTSAQPTDRFSLAVTGAYG